MDSLIMHLTCQLFLIHFLANKNVLSVFDGPSRVGITLPSCHLVLPPPQGMGGVTPYEHKQNQGWEVLNKWLAVTELVSDKWNFTEICLTLQLLTTAFIKIPTIIDTLTEHDPG